MNNTRVQTIINRHQQYRLSQTETKSVVGGKPSAGSGIVDFISWVACGFNHHYKYTGKTKKDLDLVIPVTFYQQKCQDCGHINWTRTAP